MPQGLQVLQEIKIFLYFPQKVVQVIENPWVGTDYAVCEPKLLISNLNQIQTAVNGKHKKHILVALVISKFRVLCFYLSIYLCLKYNVLNKLFCLVHQVGHLYVQDTKQRLYNITLLQLKQQLLRLSVRHGARWDFSITTLAALLTLSSLPRLWTNTEADFPSWRMAEYMVSPEGRVSSGSSRIQLRTALLSAPMAAFVSGPGGQWGGQRDVKYASKTLCGNAKLSVVTHANINTPQSHTLIPVPLYWMYRCCVGS